VTPKAYYIAERIEQARLMVQFTTHSVHEVAVATGFGSYTTLSQRYKKAFALTPIQERRQRTQNWGNRFGACET
jgi:AraC family transcriptional regulator, glycine betaine-responsive activator